MEPLLFNAETIIGPGTFIWGPIMGGLNMPNQKRFGPTHVCLLIVRAPNFNYPLALLSTVHVCWSSPITGPTNLLLTDPCTISKAYD